MNHLTRIKNKLTTSILNNFLFNFIIRSIGLEEKVFHRMNPYLSYIPSSERTTQENAGYSDRPEINEVIHKSKNDLMDSIASHCQKNDRILDVGCGPGMYLSLLKDKGYELTAIDINSAMIEASKKLIPYANYRTGDLLDLELKNNFNFIYCIGMLVYIPKNKIHRFIEKIYYLLAPNGILYLNYPHAISRLDTLYNDLTYIRYSPQFIERIIEPYFKILKHEQAFDGRNISSYDKKPYKSLNENTDRTYKNSYLLIAQKKS